MHKESSFYSTRNFTDNHWQKCKSTTDSTIHSSLEAPHGSLCNTHSIVNHTQFIDLCASVHGAIYTWQLTTLSQCWLLLSFAGADTHWEHLALQLLCMLESLVESLLESLIESLLESVFESLLESLIESLLVSLLQSLLVSLAWQCWASAVVAFLHVVWGWLNSEFVKTLANRRLKSVDALTLMLT